MFLQKVVVQIVILRTAQYPRQGSRSIFTNQALLAATVKMLATTLLALFAAAAAASPAYPKTPVASIKNGTLAGVHSPSYNQDFFLGVPFAQPPVGDLRFRQARSLNTTWPSVRDASRYADHCVGYGVRLPASNVAEELTSVRSLIRPSTRRLKTVCTSMSCALRATRARNCPLHSGSTEGRSLTEAVRISATTCPSSWSSR
jgi:hypothetical protein